MALQIFSVNYQNLNVRLGAPPLYDVAIMGGASGMTAGAITKFYKSTISSAGVGPAADLGSFLLNQGGLDYVYIAAQTPLAGDALSALPVYHSVGSGAGTIAASGSPLDSYLLRVEILLTGSLTTAQIRYSLDDGFTFSSAITISTTLALTTPQGGATGVTLTFTGSVGAFVQGDVYNLAVFAPQYVASGTGSISDLEAKINTQGDISLLCIENTPNTGSALDSVNLTSFQGVLATIGPLLSTAESNSKYQALFTGLPRSHAVLPAMMGSDGTTTFATAVTTAVTQTHDRFTGIGAGYVCLQSPQGYRAWRPSWWLDVLRQLQNLNPRKTIADWSSNPFSDYILACTPTVTTTIQDYTQRPLMYGCTYDEAITASGSTGLLGPAGFLTLTSRNRQPDNYFWFSHPIAHTLSSSIFWESQNRLGVDTFIRAIEDGLASFYGQEIQSKLDGTGQLSTAGAASVENRVTADYLGPLVQKTWLKAWPPGSSMKYVSVHTDNNVALTNKLIVDCNWPTPTYVYSFQLQITAVF